MRDKVARALANVIPERVGYWFLIKTGVEYIGGPKRPTEVVPEVPYTEVLNRYGR